MSSTTIDRERHPFEKCLHLQLVAALSADLARDVMKYGVPVHLSLAHFRTFLQLTAGSLERVPQNVFPRPMISHDRPIQTYRAPPILETDTRAIFIAGSTIGQHGDLMNKTILMWVSSFDLH